MRILHYEIVMNSFGLAMAERKLGHDNIVVERKGGLHRLPVDKNLQLDRGNYFNKLFKLITYFLKVRNSFDIFHFQFGLSFIDFEIKYFNHLDLPYYPKNVKLVFTYNGDDARMNYSVVDGIDFNEYLRDYTITKAHFNKNRRLQKIKKVDRYAHHIFAVNPDLMNFLPERTSFLPYTMCNFYTIEKVNKRFDKENFTIVHAPTNRMVKGTEFIEKALVKLREIYPFVQIVYVENVTNAEALEIYKTADLLIDQVIIGWYGGLAVEVMRMGIPVACYLREEDFHFVPEEMISDLKNAIIQISPLNIVEPIQKLIEDRKKLSEYAEHGFNYVTKWHDPLRVAQKVVEVYSRTLKPRN
ncbi:MAG: hypothetical protein ABI851_08175 [Saprospiraceae bacterium]